MTSRKIFVVFGATGNQGGSVINTFLSDPVLSEQFQLRGVTRDPSKESAAALSSKGVEMVKVCPVPWLSEFRTDMTSSSRATSMI